MLRCSSAGQFVRVDASRSSVVLANPDVRILDTVGSARRRSRPDADIKVFLAGIHNQA